jgi:lysophospholipase L1-like esterase
MTAPRSRARTILGNLGLGLASTGLMLGGLEVAARLVQPRGGGKEEQTTARYTEYDPTLGWRKKANGRATFHRREYTIDVSINGNGLRGPERPYAAAPGTWRILTLGDSFVEGQGVTDEATATRLLETSLRGPGCAVETINGGTIGYSTDQEYLFYVEEGSRYAPQLVVLFFYYNDILSTTSENYYGRPKPLLVFRGGVPKLSRPARWEPRPEPPPQADTAVETHRGSALAAWVRDRMRRGAPRAYNALSRLGLWAPIRPIPARREMYVLRKDPPRFVEQAWDKTAAILETLRQRVEAGGARLLVVYVPSRMEVSDRDWELTRLTYGLDDGEWDRSRVRERLRALGVASRFATLDLTAALRRADRGLLGGPYYVYDGHWNALGHRIAAREVAAFLKAQGWLPACASQRNVD